MKKRPSARASGAPWRVDHRLKGFLDGLQEFDGTVSRQPDLLLGPDIVAGPNQELLSTARNKLVNCGQEVDRALAHIREQVTTTRRHFDLTRADLSKAHTEQELAYRELIEKHRAAQGQASQRAKLEKHRAELIGKQRLRDELTGKLEKLQAERQKLLDRLSELRNQQFAVRERIVQIINQRVGPGIRVSILQEGNPAPYKKLLEDALKDAKVNRNMVAERLVNAFGPDELAETVKNRDQAALVEKGGLNRDQASKVMAALMDSDQLFELEAVDMIDLPVIELKDGDDYKSLTSLSEGQRCTAILPILLLESDGPLLVDQPEDNLDAEFLCDTVVENIRKLKQQRQMIFVTHDPNIPVLGDAERVFVLKSNGRAARIVGQGTVDECREQIVKLLEGGEEAFVRRQKRYRLPK